MLPTPHKDDCVWAGEMRRREGVPWAWVWTWAGMGVGDTYVLPLPISRLVFAHAPGNLHISSLEVFKVEKMALSCGL